MLEQYVKKILTSRVYDVAVETPLHSAGQLSKRLGNTVLLKREDLQPVFSFKIRGAYNKLAQLSAEELARGVRLVAIEGRGLVIERGGQHSRVEVPVLAQASFWGQAPQPSAN